MAWFRRRRARASTDTSGEAARATIGHLREFVATRHGVEAFVEPATNVTQTTVVLVALTGEWTRRKVPDAAAARAMARELGIQIYDVQLTGYPSRMREWNARKRSD